MFCLWKQNKVSISNESSVLLACGFSKKGISGIFLLTLEIVKDEFSGRLTLAAIEQDKKFSAPLQFMRSFPFMPFPLVYLGRA